MTQNQHSGTEARLRLGTMLAERSRRIGLADDDVA